MKSASLIALYDACVLYPAPLRDLLMHLALTGLFQARWTEQIHDEWIRNLHEDRPELPLAKLERVRRLMNAHAEDCLVTDYESLMDALVLPDQMTAMFLRQPSGPKPALSSPTIFRIFRRSPWSRMVLRQSTQMPLSCG